MEWLQPRFARVDSQPDAQPALSAYRAQALEKEVANLPHEQRSEEMTSGLSRRYASLSPKAEVPLGLDLVGKPHDGLALTCRRAQDADEIAIASARTELNLEIFVFHARPDRHRPGREGLVEGETPILGEWPTPAPAPCAPSAEGS
jgi:hypothetical protein